MLLLTASALRYVSAPLFLGGQFPKPDQLTLPTLHPFNAWIRVLISFTTGEEFPYFDENDVEHYVHTPEELWDLIQNYK